MINDFNLIEEEAAANTDDFAKVGAVEAPTAATPLPVRTAILSVATADDSPASTTMALTEQNIAATRQIIESGQEFQARIRVADQQQRRNLRSLNNLRSSSAMVSPETSRMVDEGYRSVAAQRVEDNAKTSAELETVRRIQDHLTAGENVEAKLSYNLLTKGNAEKRWTEEAVKNMLLMQYVEKAKAETQDVGIGATIYNFITGMIPFGNSMELHNVVPGYQQSGLEFFKGGTTAANQGQYLWDKYSSSELAAALAPGGELDNAIKTSAATTPFGTYDPNAVARIAGSLHYQSESDKKWANAWTIGEPALMLAPELGALKSVPWKAGGGIVDILTRTGSRSGARKAVSEAFNIVESEGSEAAMARTGMGTDEVVSHLEPTALNPNASTANSVPHAVDIDTHLKAADEALRQLPENIQVTRATTPEEIQHAYEAAVKAEELKLGKSIKDVKFLVEDIRTGERTAFNPSVLPEQGKVVHRIEYTIGKRDGGGFATRRAALAEARKRGIYGAEVEMVEVEGKLISNADRGFTDRVYHGTADAFDEFDETLAGKATGGENTKGGVLFFTSNPDIAGSYAVRAASAKATDSAENLRAMLAGKKPIPAGKTEAQIEDELINAFDNLLDNGGANIRAHDIDTSNFYVADMKGASYNGPITQSILDNARAKGHDGVVFKNFDDDIAAVYDMGRQSDVYAVFNKQKIAPAYSEIMRDVSGQYFVKGSAIVKEEGFYTTPLNTPNNNMIAGLRSDARRMDRNAQQKAVAAGSNAERFSSAMQKHVKEALGGVAKKDKLFLDEIIRKGQNQEKWLTDGEFRSLFERASGDLPDDKVVMAYKKYRLFNDMEYQLRNDEIYKQLAVTGHETVRFEIAGFDIEQTAKVNAKPKRPTERVYNVTDKIHYAGDEALSSAELDRLVGEGYVLVTTKEVVRMPDGVQIRNFLMKRGDMERQPLNRTQLGYSEGGHRLYTGRYFAKQATGGVQPDTGQKFLKNPNVFRTGNNPNRLRDWAKVMNDAIDDFNKGIFDPQHYDDNVFSSSPGLHFPSGEEFLKQIDNGTIDTKNKIQIVGDREMPDEYLTARDDVARFVDEEESATTGYYRSTGRLFTGKKGQALLDESGEFAETVDPWETMNTALANISRTSSLSNYKMGTVERFSKTYGQYLEMRQLESATPMDLVNAKVKQGIPGRIVRQINAEQQGMKRILNFETGFEKGVRQANVELAGWILGDARGGLQQAGHDFVFWLQKNNPVQFLRSLAFDAKLGMFNFGQLFLQSSTMAASIALHPKHGMDGMKSLAPLYSYIMSNGNKSVLDVVAKRSWKISGFESEREFKDFATFVERTGFMNVGNTHLMINAFGPNRVFGAASMVDGVREKGRSMFYMAEMFNRSVSSRIAYNLLKERGVQLGSAEFREKFIGLADDLSMNMTSESAASFQHGLWSIPTQFWAYNVRMMDAMMGNGFTAAQKTRLIASQFLLYGAGGVPIVDTLTDYVKRNDPEAVDNNKIESLLGTLDRGMIDKAINAVTGADVRFGERVGTGQFLTDTIKDLFGMGEYGEKSPIEAFGGATFSITGAGLKTVNDVVKYAVAESGGDQGWVITRDNLLKMASNISTFSNVNKAIIAYNYGIYKSAKGNVQAHGLPQSDAIWIAMGIRPQELDDLSMMSSYLENKENLVKEAATQVRNWRQEAFEVPDKFEENMQKVNTFVQLLPAEVRQDVMKQTNKITDRSFYDKIKKKYDEELLSEQTIEPTQETE